MKAPNQIWTEPADLSKRLLQVAPSPVLVDPEDNILAEGRVGDTHRQVFYRALATSQNDNTRIGLIEAFNNDIQHKFSLTKSDGKPIFNENGMRIIMDRIEAGKIADASGQRSRQYRGTPLHTQQLRTRGARHRFVRVRKARPG